ncbi:MAG: ribosome silencing factor [Acetobacteraceae bacterium]|nr:ribosome silencing factor [Acetobacteraceae bacterium]
MDWRGLALAAAGAAEEGKASRVMLLDVRSLTLVADYFLILSAPTRVQVKAVADRIEERLSRLGARPRHREGYPAGTWVLLDYGPLVVHAFREEERRFYNLERLWGDAPALDLGGLAAGGGGGGGGGPGTS